MKIMRLYQVYDNVGQTAITGIIPANNNLTAALGFLNAYIKEKDITKNPYKYKALDLICVANLELDEDGIVKKVTPAEWNCSGVDIVKYIQDEMAARGVDDFVLDDEEKE